jgi:hypothetical protein
LAHRGSTERHYQGPEFTIQADPDWPPSREAVSGNRSGLDRTGIGWESGYPTEPSRPKWIDPDWPPSREAVSGNRSGLDRTGIGWESGYPTEPSRPKWIDPDWPPSREAVSGNRSGLDRTGIGWESGYPNRSTVEQLSRPTHQTYDGPKYGKWTVDSANRSTVIPTTTLPPVRADVEPSICCTATDSANVTE